MFHLRTDTTTKQKDEKPIDRNRQQIVFGLAVRGEGKSFLMECTVEDEFWDGYTVLDLHAPPNFENAFWCIPNLDPDGNLLKIPNDEIREQSLKKLYKNFMKNRQYYLKKGKPIAITILCSESCIYGQDALDNFNGRIYNQDEWYADNKNNGKQFNIIYPQRKPENKWGKELIRFVRLPNITKKEDSETNQKALEIITKTILDARVGRRIVVLNRKAFATENQYFWTMELIHRSLWKICDEHFTILTPEDVGKQSYSEMTKVEKKWNRLTMFHRELGELAPAKLKADKSGESTPVKKSLLGMARVCRHWLIDWFADWQKNNDVEDAIRNQADIWYFKKYNRELGGDEKKSFFDKVDFLRKAIIEKGKNSKMAQAVANSLFPKVEELTRRYYYAKFLSTRIKLFEVPKMKHQHKEPWMKFEEITGIWISHDLSKIPQESAVGSVKAKKSDEMSIFNIIWGMKNPPKGKGMNWEQIKTKLTELQKAEDISYPQLFSSVTKDALIKKYQRWAKKFNEPAEITSN